MCSASHKEFDCVLKKNCASYEECKCDEIKCSFEEDCANCIYYNADRDDQPCCYCVRGDCFEQVPNIKDKIVEILKAYTKKHNIAASSVILEEYAEELVKNGVVFKGSEVEGE